MAQKDSEPAGGPTQRQGDHASSILLAIPESVVTRLIDAREVLGCAADEGDLGAALDYRIHMATAEIAQAFLNINEPGKAAMAWELRYIIEPSAWDAAAQAAIAWIEAGMTRPATWWYERARVAAPDSPEVQMLATVIQSARANER